MVYTVCAQMVSGAQMVRLAPKWYCWRPNGTSGAQMVSVGGRPNDTTQAPKWYFILYTGTEPFFLRFRFLAFSILRFRFLTFFAIFERFRFLGTAASLIYIYIYIYMCIYIYISTVALTIGLSKFANGS